MTAANYTPSVPVMPGPRNSAPSAGERNYVRASVTRTTGTPTIGRDAYATREARADLERERRALLRALADEQLIVAAAAAGIRTDGLLDELRYQRRHRTWRSRR